MHVQFKMYPNNRIEKGKLSSNYCETIQKMIEDPIRFFPIDQD